MRRFCGSMTFLSPTSVEDIHWTLSFLQPPTDSWGKGRPLPFTSVLRRQYMYPQTAKITNKNLKKSLYFTYFCISLTSISSNSDWLWVVTFLARYLAVSLGVFGMQSLPPAAAAEHTHFTPTEEIQSRQQIVKTEISDNVKFWDAVMPRVSFLMS